jgi:hypothetical protein
MLHWLYSLDLKENKIKLKGCQLPVSHVHCLLQQCGARTIFQIFTYKDVPKFVKATTKILEIERALILNSTTRSLSPVHKKILYTNICILLFVHKSLLLGYKTETSSETPVYS